MAKMGLGGFLLGAAALAAASAATSNSNGNRGNVNKYDKYNIEYDVDGNELTDNEKIIKSIIKSGNLQVANQDLRECVTSKGKVDQRQALGPLVNYLVTMDRFFI